MSEVIILNLETVKNKAGGLDGCLYLTEFYEHESTIESVNLF